MREPIVSLKRLRENRRLSLKVAARQIGIAPGTLYRAEQGLGVSPHTAMLISRWHGIAVSDWHPKFRGPNV